MSLTPALLDFAIAYGLVLALPGTNFLIVAQAGATRSCGTALAAACGLGCGAALLATLALSGAALLTGDARAVTFAKLVLAVVLLTIGLKALRRACRVHEAGPTFEQTGACGYFGLGLVTAATNPVTSAFFIGTYVTAAGSAPGSGHWLFVALVFAVATTWFGAVALLFSSRTVRTAYAGARRTVDLGIGAILAGMGVVTVARVLLS